MIISLSMDKIVLSVRLASKLCTVARAGELYQFALSAFYGLVPEDDLSEPYLLSLRLTGRPRRKGRRWPNEAASQDVVDQGRPSAALTPKLGPARAQLNCRE